MQITTHESDDYSLLDLHELVLVEIGPVVDGIIACLLLGRHGKVHHLEAVSPLFNTRLIGFMVPVFGCLPPHRQTVTDRHRLNQCDARPLRSKPQCRSAGRLCRTQRRSMSCSTMRLAPKALFPESVRAMRGKAVSLWSVTRIPYF